MGTSLTMSSNSTLILSDTTFTGSVTGTDLTSSVSIDGLSSGYGGTITTATKTFLENALTLNYTPTTPSDWTVVPTLVQGALDTLASTIVNHLNDTSAAHAASAISTVAGSNVHATTLTVQGDINALDNAISSIVVTSTLNDLTDVDTTGVQADYGIVYDGVSQYVAVPLSSTRDLTSNILFNATFNTNANDSSIYAATGTLAGNTTQIVGKLGNAYTFDGTNDYVTYGILSHLIFTISSTYTINFWMRTSVSGTNERYITGMFDPPNTFGWCLRHHPNQQEIRFIISDGASARNLDVYFSPSSGTLNNNVWHNICLVKKAGHLGSSVDCYIDGVLANKTIQVTTLLSTDNITTTGIPFNIGSVNNGAPIDYEGDLDNMVIFNFAMVKSQVEALFNNNNGTETYTAVKTLMVEHNHPISEIVGLESRLTTNESNIASKVASVTSGNSNIQMFGSATAPIVTLQDTLTSLVSITTGTISTTSGSITTAPTTSNHIVNKAYCDRTTKNLLSDINLQIFTFPASNFVPNSTTLSANESLTVNLNTGALNTNNYLCSFQGYGSPQKAFHSLSTQQRTFFAVKLTGSSWAGHEMGNCRIGWATRDWFGLSESNITSSTSLLALTWNTSNTSANKGYTMSFFGSSGFLIYNGASNSVTRTNFTIANSVAQQNDILIASFVPSSNSFITYWYRGGVLGCQASGTYPSGDANSNFMASNIVPVFTPASSGTNYQFQVLSSRDFALEGISLSNHVNYFY